MAVAHLCGGRIGHGTGAFFPAGGQEGLCTMGVPKVVIPSRFMSHFSNSTRGGGLHYCSVCVGKAQVRSSAHNKEICLSS